MTGVVIASICGFLFIVLLNVLQKSRTRYKEIDEKYGKPYEAKLIKMIGGHPELKRGSMAISFHPKDAIAFNRKVFSFSQINSIRIISKLPQKLKSNRKINVNFEANEQFLCISVSDETGEHEVVFTASSDFETIANKLTQKWNKYNLLS